jgi:FlaA1/EpsC-like NDP-sugar epimerase
VVRRADRTQGKINAGGGKTIALLERLLTPFAAFAHDVLMVPAAWLGAYGLRFNLGAVPEPFLSCALDVLPLVLVSEVGVFWYIGLYRGLWRFASLPDPARIARAVLVGAAFSAALLFLFTRMEHIPRSVFPLYGLLLVGFLAVRRLAYRWFKDHALHLGPQTRVLIAGAGDAGEMLARDLLRDGAADYVPVAFVDDDRPRRGREIRGVRVEGAYEDLPAVGQARGVGLVILALPEASAGQMRRVMALCEEARVPFRTVPPIQDLVSGRSALRELREVSIEDSKGHGLAPTGELDALAHHAAHP